jgi:hypothetical protein
MLALPAWQLRSGVRRPYLVNPVASKRPLIFTLRRPSLISSLGKPENRLPPTQSLESVVGGVLVCFGERGDVERGMDKCVDLLIATKGSLAEVNQLSRDWPTM